MDDPLPAEELQRCERQVRLPQVGAEGQRRLREARVLLVGLGGLGSPAALYLAAAGVGTLGLADSDAVERSNLQRQVLFSTADLGRAKAEAAGPRLAGLQPGVRLIRHPVRLTSRNALEVLSGYDVVLDGSDNFRTRYLVNDACALLGKPDVHGAVSGFEGRVTVYWAARGPCARCLHREPPPPGSVPSCAEAGVLGAVPGVIGSLQALEALKLLLGAGEPLIGTLLLFDGLAGGFRRLSLAKDPACPLCGPSPSITGLADEPGSLRPERLRERLAAREPLSLLDVREPAEHALVRLDGARLVPLAELPERLGELDPEAEWVVLCRSGARAARAVELLRRAGFRRAAALEGGLDAWLAREAAPC